ncbi:hypothetical protein GPALN_005821 [Globodera pallida]|nr:hypothetical protein GPALN_005821 [Globodera pallida]
MRSCQWFAIICVLVLPGKLQSCHPTAPGTASDPGTSDTASATNAAAATTAAAVTTAAAAAAAAATGSCTSCLESDLSLIAPAEVFPLTDRPALGAPGFAGAKSTDRTDAVVGKDATGCSTLTLTCAINPTLQPVLIRIIIRQPVSDPMNFDTEVRPSGFFTLTCKNGVWTAPANTLGGNPGRQVDRYACVNTVS